MCVYMCVCVCLIPRSSCASLMSHKGQTRVNSETTGRRKKKNIFTHHPCK